MLWMPDRADRVRRRPDTGEPCPYSMRQGSLSASISDRCEAYMTDHCCHLQSGIVV